ncbi:lipopolysaccharide biosynthesis protein [Ferruginibacter sp.]
MPASNSETPNTPARFNLTGFAERSFLLICSSLLRLAVQLAILFIFSRKLPVADYGLYQSVWLYSNVISVIAVFGLPSLILSVTITDIRKWIAANKKTFAFAAISLHLLPILYILLFAEKYDPVTKLLLLALVLVQNISILTEALAIKNKKEKKVLISNIVFSLGYLAVHLYAIYISWSLPFILAGIIVMHIVKTLFLWPSKNSLQSNTAAVASASTGKQWLYLGINDTAGVLFKWIDKWLILSFLPLTQFALYTNGSYEIPVFGLMLSAVGNIMLVDLSEKEGGIAQHIQQAFKRSSTLLASVVFPAFCFLFFYSNTFFTFLFSDKYATAIPIFVISIFVLPVRITSFTAVLQAYHSNDIIVKGAVLDLLLAAVFMAILYPIFKLNGLAAAFVLSTYIQAAYYLWQTGKLVDQKITQFFPFRQLIYMMLIAVLVMSASFYLPGLLSYSANMFAGAAICLLLILAQLYYQYKKIKKD